VIHAVVVGTTLSVTCKAPLRTRLTKNLGSLADRYVQIAIRLPSIASSIHCQRSRSHSSSRLSMASPQPPASARPPAINYVASFILVGLAWGLTTPFIRAAARDHRPSAHPSLDSDALKQAPLRRRVLSAWFAVVDLLRNPRYAVPLLLNLTGSVWFFLLIGQAGTCLCV
jgi:hypothetical protein